MQARRLPGCAIIGLKGAMPLLGGTVSFEQLDFATYCIGALAAKLGMTQREAYNKLKESGILHEYLIPAYDVLHTFSRDYIVDDLMSLMREKGVIA